jgi:Putative GTPases (G3E family)
MTPPREMRTEGPVRLALVGGFLGAGKTTALEALARELTRRGKRVGIVTNDQAAGLVDTQTLGRLQLPIAEVAGGCFCCRFEDLLDSAQRVLDRAPVDVLLCEPVGSCTDMAATVLEPLRRFYGGVLRLAPFTVLVDPARSEEMASLPASVAYIFEKQLEEADVLAVSKSDLLAEEEARRLATELGARHGKAAFALSGWSGDGIAHWADLLLDEGESPIRALQSIDYDLYAEGEAELGWLNAAAEVTAVPSLDAGQFARDVLNRIQTVCAAERAAIAHVKASIADGSDVLLARANLTQTEGTPVVAAGDADSLYTSRATLTLNARVGIDPGILGGIVIEAVQGAAAEAGATARITSLQSFRPGYPRPPYRFAGPAVL